LSQIFNSLSLQFLDKRDKDEPVMTIEDDAVDYDA